jgi:DNA-binding beta-propeller fold protein YncE
MDGSPEKRLRLAFWAAVLVLFVIAGFVVVRHSAARGEPEIVWGKRGTQPGDFVRPRAIAIDAQDRLYIVDFTARIQRYDRNGVFSGHSWQTPDFRNGRPSGLSIDRDGNLLVSDSHYFCVRVYSPDGEELRSFGPASGVPDGISYISDTVQDEDGNYYLAEFGDHHRITKLDPSGKFLLCWGTAGTGPGEFGRLRALCLGPDKNLYAVDATNHLIKVFTRDGKEVRTIGEPGEKAGQLSYPYDIAFNAAGEFYVVEHGNHRVQKFSKDGVSLGLWGTAGRQPGCLHEPWALAVDSRGCVHIVDTENHRVQRIRF